MPTLRMVMAHQLDQKEAELRVRKYVGLIVQRNEGQIRLMNEGWTRGCASFGVRLMGCWVDATLEVYTKQLVFCLTYPLSEGFLDFVHVQVEAMVREHIALAFAREAGQDEVLCEKANT